MSDDSKVAIITYFLTWMPQKSPFSSAVAAGELRRSEGFANPKYRLNGNWSALHSIRATLEKKPVIRSVSSCRFQPAAGARPFLL
jgi:hypothetical protein